MPEALPRYLESGAPGWLTEMEVSGLDGLKVLSTLSSMSCDPPPCHPLEPQLCLSMTLTTHVLILLHLVSSFQKPHSGCYHPHFPAEEREAQKGRILRVTQMGRC